jgi:integrase/recombinase XerD
MARKKGSSQIAKELTQEEIQRINNFLIGTRHELRNKALFNLGLGSGMRIAEMVEIQIKDVSPCEIALCDRIVPISDSARVHVLNWVNSRVILNKESPLFPSQKHPEQPMGVNYAVQMLSQIFADAGVSNASSHSMRRTFIRGLINAGEGIEDIRDKVGFLRLATMVKYFRKKPRDIKIVKCRSYPKGRVTRVTPCQR